MGVLGKLPGWNAKSTSLRYTARIAYAFIFFWVFFIGALVTITVLGYVVAWIFPPEPLPNYEVFYVEVYKDGYYRLRVATPLNITEGQLIAISEEIVANLKQQYGNVKWVTFHFFEDKDDYYKLYMAQFAGVCYIEKGASPIVPETCEEGWFKVYDYAPDAYREIKKVALNYSEV